MDLRSLRPLVAALMVIGVAACGDKDGETEAAEIAVARGNRAPVISGEPAARIIAGETYDFTPVASDPDGDPIIFGSDGLPGWLSFDTKTGRLTGTPGTVDVGMHRGIVLWVSDGLKESLLPTLDLEVLPETAARNRPPEISGAPLESVTAGVIYDFLPVVVDPDGDPMSFEITNRPAWATFTAATGRLSGTPGTNAVGVYGDIVIQVSDGVDTAALGPFIIRVDAPPSRNSAPVISGVPQGAVDAGVAWSFQPQASDADGDTLSFQVFNAPAWMNLDSATGLLSGTPVTGDAGVHGGITIVVSDGQASASLAAFSVQVVTPNSPPAISGSPPGQATVGQVYDFVPTANDPNGDTLVFSIQSRPSWATFNTSTGRLTGTPNASQVRTYNGIRITVSDGTSTDTLGPFSVTVSASNAPPTIGGTPAGSVTAGSIYDFVPVAADPDGDPMTFEITNRPAWASFTAATGRLSGTPGAGAVGVYGDIVISVSDGVATAALAPFIIQVNAPPSQNSPPVISGVPEGAVDAGVTWSFQPQASDADGDTLSFQVFNAPGWTSFNAATGQLSGTPTTANAGVHGGITIVVSDGQASATLPAFSIQVVTPNSPPEITGNPPAQATVGQAYDFVPTANDPNGDALVFSIQSRPSWANFNTTTGRLSGTPNASHIRSYTGIRITVSDGTSTDTLGPFSIAVSAANAPPTISGTPAASVTAGSIYDFIPVAVDPDGDAMTFQIANRPAWATFASATGRLSGTPDSSDVGAYGNIVISVSDGVETAALASFVIQVDAPPSQNSPPVISGVPAPAVDAGDAWVFQPQASDPDDDMLSFQVFNAPAWTTFNSATGRLSGTPTAGDAGAHGGITIVVSDGEASATLAAFSVQVIDPNSPPVISGSPSGQVTAGQAYSFTPTASDPDGDTLVFSIQNRPTWANFNTGTGRLSGTPNASHVRSYTGIRITVSDGSETDTLGPFSITVAAANAPPTISGTPAGSALAGQAYSFVPNADDPDDDTLVFSVTGLPGWASFSTATGAVTGTPEQGDVGTYPNIRIAVSDGALNATLPGFSIQVTGITTGTATLSWTPPTENTDGSPLSDLDGYIVYWGTSAGNYSHSADIANPGITTYVVDNLLPGTTYYFATTAYNSDGLESSYSNEASKTIP